MYEVSFKQQYFGDTYFTLTVENKQEVTKRQMHFCFSLLLVNQFIILGQFHRYVH